LGSGMGGAAGAPPGATCGGCSTGRGSAVVATTWLMPPGAGSGAKLEPLEIDRGEPVEDVPPRPDVPDAAPATAVFVPCRWPGALCLLSV
jgi:hypothetical protein